MPPGSDELAAIRHKDIHHVLVKRRRHSGGDAHAFSAIGDEADLHGLFDTMIELHQIGDDLSYLFEQSLDRFGFRDQPFDVRALGPPHTRIRIPMGQNFEGLRAALLSGMRPRRPGQTRPTRLSNGFAHVG